MLSNEAPVPFASMPRLFAPLALACKSAADRCCGNGEGADRDRIRADLIEMEDMLHNAIDFVHGVDVSDPLRDVDMQSLIESLAEDFREMGHDIAVHGTVTRFLPGYARNLRRCLQNLLENAPVLHSMSSSMWMTRLPSCESPFPTMGLA